MKIFKICIYVMISFFLISKPGFSLDLKSNVILLVDFSTSYYTPERVEKAIKKNIKDLSKLISSKKDGNLFCS